MHRSGRTSITEQESSHFAVFKKNIVSLLGACANPMYSLTHTYGDDYVVFPFAPCGSFISVPEGMGTTSHSAAGGCQISFYGQNE